MELNIFIYIKKSRLLYYFSEIKDERLIFNNKNNNNSKKKRKKNDNNSDLATFRWETLAHMYIYFRI